jgi:hypothetical protein
MNVFSRCTIVPGEDGLVGGPATGVAYTTASLTGAPD